MNIERYERIVVTIGKDDPEVVVSKFDSSEKVRATSLTITGPDCWAKGYPIRGDKVYNRSKELLSHTKDLPEWVLARITLHLLSTVESEP